MYVTHRSFAAPAPAIRDFFWLYHTYSPLRGGFYNASSGFDLWATILRGQLLAILDISAAPPKYLLLSLLKPFTETMSSHFLSFGWSRFVWIITVETTENDLVQYFKEARKLYAPRPDHTNSGLGLSETSETIYLQRQEGPDPRVFNHTSIYSLNYMVWAFETIKI